MIGMKSIIFHLVPVAVSMIWLISYNNTCNVIALKVPDFLKFNMLLLTGFYLSVYALKFLNKALSKTTFYFLMTIFILGIVKLMRGLYLGKPIGYLLIILIIEGIVILFYRFTYFNQKFK